MRMKKEKKRRRRVNGRYSAKVRERLMKNEGRGVMWKNEPFGLDFPPVTRHPLCAFSSMIDIYPPP